MKTPKRTERDSESRHKSDEMAKADVANGERPDQPTSPEHSSYERRRTGLTRDEERDAD